MGFLKSVAKGVASIQSGGLSNVLSSKTGQKFAPVAVGAGLGALVGNPMAGAGIGASLFSSDSVAEAMRDANQKNVEMAREQQSFSAGQALKEMDFQERMSNTAYQRSVDDMKKAGINPLMAVSNGGASTPGGAMGSSSLPDVQPVPSVVANTISSAIDLLRTFTDVKKSFAEADAAHASADLARKNLPKVEADTEKTRADTEASRFEQRTYRLLNGVFDRVIGAWDNSAKSRGGIPIGPRLEFNPFYPSK